MKKDPYAILDYKFDWSDWLGSDTIASYEIVTPTGIIKESDSSTSDSVQVILSGGTAGVTYQIACRIITTAGLQDERTMQIQCEDR